MCNTPSHLNTSLQQMQVHDHVCFLFSEPEESFRVSLPFIQLGLERGDKCLYIADDRSCETFHHMMRAEIEQYEFYLANGALEIVPSHENYLKDGYFDSDGVISLLEQKANQAKQQGFTALRILGDAECLCGSKTPLESFIEYEAKVNILFPRQDILALCQYNRYKFPANILLDVIKTHPTVLVNDELCQNYYYIPPDEFPHRRDADQELDWYLTVIRDQKRSTQSIKETESQYRNLYNTMAQGVVYQEADETISSMNPAAMNILGLTAEEIQNRTSASPEWKTIWEDGSPFPGEEHPSMVALRTGQRVDDVVMGVYNPKEQAHRWIQINAVPEFQPGEKVPYRVYTTFSDITERKRAEKALKESEEKYRALVMQSADCLTLHDLEGRILDVNSCSCETYGYSRDEFLQMKISDLDPDYHERAAGGAFYERMRPGEAVLFEARQRAKDGREFPAEIRLSLVKIGGKTMIQALCRDISERKQAEEALLESERQKNLILNSTSEMVAYYDTDLHVIWANRASAESVNMTERELVGRHCYEIWHQRQEPCPDCPLLNARDTKKPQTGEVQTPDGRYWSLRGYPILDESGKVASLVEFGQDITARKQAEEELIRQQRIITLNNQIANVFLSAPREELYADVLDVVLNALNSQYGSFGYIDKEKNLVCPSMTRDIWEQCQVENKSIVFPREAWGGLWGRSLKEKCTLAANEGLRVPKGHVMLENAMAVPIVHQDELIGQFVVANKPGGFTEEDRELLENAASQTAPVLKARLDEERHEQERANLEEQLQQSQKMEAIGTLAGGVAHDFNNILMTILGNSQMVLENLKKEDPIHEEIQQIYQAGERATSLTSQLLAFSRKQVIHPQVMGLDTKIQELEKMLQRILGEDIDMSITCEPGVSPIKADPGQIDQVIMNLAVNARDAMPLGGRFGIEARNVHLDRSLADTHLDLSAGDYVLLSISDTGSGIPKEIQHKIFEPFFTTKQKGKGTGLGLSTVYGIVKQNGGSITVYSEVSKGATFKLYFPRATQTKVAGKEPSQSARDDSGTETILVIEDEEMVRSYVRRALTKKGYQVLTAGYYREALDAYNQAATPVDLVLTDVILPHKSGKEISDKLLAMNPSMKIIFMSGYTDDEILRHNVLHAQANYIQKPFSPIELLKIVRNVLDAD